ncbi:MAG: hypothetical protein Q8M92_02980 [Candidatus Subteraquimicrobiales bacterium]|nr:hypothetical protein [Candidatus Subteraquimicrobiales bacterium]
MTINSDKKPEIRCWIATIDKARLGATLHELNKAFHTNSQMDFDDRFHMSLNRAYINAGAYRLQVSFDYGKCCDEIVFMSHNRAVNGHDEQKNDDFTKDQLEVLLLKYSNDFQCLTHTLHTGSREFFFYSEATQILVQAGDGFYRTGVGPIRISRPPKGPVERFNKMKSQKYRTFKYNFSNPDKHIDIKKTVNYTAIPITQVRQLIRNGITQIPIK